MVDIATDKIIPLNDAARMLGRRVSYSTWWRWGTRGVRGHKLQLTRVGGRTMVSVESLQTFIAAINTPAGEPIPQHTSRQRESAIARAEVRCKHAGA